MQENSRLAGEGAAPSTQYYNDAHLTKMGEENKGCWRGPNSYGVMGYLWFHRAFRWPLGQKMETIVLKLLGNRVHVWTQQKEYNVLPSHLEGNKGENKAIHAYAS